MAVDESQKENEALFNGFAGKHNREAIFSASKIKKLEMFFRAGCDSKVQCQHETACKRKLTSGNVQTDKVIANSEKRKKDK